MIEITKGSFCITNSEGGDLTSTIFITSKYTIDVTDAYSLRQLFRGTLETELLRRAFKRGVRSALAHHFTKGRETLKRGARSVFAHHLQELQHHEYRHPPYSTHVQHKSETGITKNAETPVATQQTAAILHDTREKHDPKEVRLSKTLSSNTGIRDTYEDNLTYKGQGLTNISWK